MAQTSWPFENIDTSETQYSQLFRNLGEGVVDGKELELEPFGDGTGMNVKVRAGQALVRGHYYYNTGIETLSIAAADPTNPRIDSVVLRLDPTANSILLVVLTGVPGVSPSAPVLTQTDSGIYEQRIANVAVAANATVITSGNVTDQRTIFTPWTGSVTSVPGSAITGSITVATLPGANISGEITTATMNASRQIVTTHSKSANYSTLATDANSTIRLTGSTGRTFTIDNNLTAGQRIDFIQDGSGQITFAAGSGVTLRSVDAKLKTNKQYSGATVICYGSGVYYLVGDLAA
jgi:hypothetical protein